METALLVVFFVMLGYFVGQRSKSRNIDWRLALAAGLIAALVAAIAAVVVRLLH